MIAGVAPDQCLGTLEQGTKLPEVGPHPEKKKKRRPCSSWTGLVNRETLIQRFPPIGERNVSIVVT